MFGLQATGLYPNVEIMGILMHRSGQDWVYKLLLCKTMTRLKITPNKLLIKHIETHRLAANDAIIKQVLVLYCHLLTPAM